MDTYIISNILKIVVEVATTDLNMCDLTSFKRKVDRGYKFTKSKIPL